MLKNIPWTGLDVFLVYGLRIIMGLILVNMIFPALFSPTPFVIEMTDRVIVLILIGTVLYKYQTNVASLGFTKVKLLSSIGWGLFVGIVLLGVSSFSEKLLSSVFLLTPSQHPLVAQVEQAGSWQDLMGPLFLAGILAPFVEEVLYRGFTFPVLMRRGGLWFGALASALIFAALHFSLYWLPEMLLVGTGLALLYYYTGSIYSAMLAHALINTGKIFIIFFNFRLI